MPDVTTTDRSVRNITALCGELNKYYTLYRGETDASVRQHLKEIADHIAYSIGADVLTFRESL